ncbi:hypothetical protein JQC91_15965 [Jannaschia sp. Os4]|uniref:hypothetical protein n=1 Tax=Jannaschia sp. Os4 TaxID=2807617 RepID=UPI00193A0337|nr:hypothetical protein [Jannaschia sp. Os4]MBM2577803.1 hypothetical protein [Jannaschia sp. Os4]
MIKNFIASESGAVTVDWVVLTAALVGLGLAVMGVVSTGVQSASNQIGGALSSDTLIQSTFQQSTTTTGTGDDAVTTTTALGFNNNASTLPAE